MTPYKFRIIITIIIIIIIIITGRIWKGHTRTLLYDHSCKRILNSLKAINVNSTNQCIFVFTGFVCIVIVKFDFI